MPYAWRGGHLRQVPLPRFEVPSGTEFKYWPNIYTLREGVGHQVSAEALSQLYGLQQDRGSAIERGKRGERCHAGSICHDTSCVDPGESPKTRWTRTPGSTRRTFRTLIIPVIPGLGRSPSRNPVRSRTQSQPYRAFKADRRSLSAEWSLRSFIPWLLCCAVPFAARKAPDLLRRVTELALRL